MPCVVNWILMFYGFFQCFLNLLAEATLFADREFYKVFFGTEIFNRIGGTVKI
jgi:hypothetical protein